MNLNIEMDPKKLAEIDRQISILMSQNKIDAAINRAARRAADGAKAEAARQTPKQYTLVKGHISKTLSTGFNKGTGIVGASMRIKDGAVALPKFGGTNPKTPNPKNPELQKIHVKQSMAVHTIRPWFAARMATGHIGIFSRAKDEYMTHPYRDHRLHGKDSVWRGSRHAKWSHKRERIVEKFSIGASRMFANEDISGPVTERAMTVLRERINHEIGRLLNK